MWGLGRPEGGLDPGDGSGRTLQRTLMTHRHQCPRRLRTLSGAGRTGIGLARRRHQASAVLWNMLPTMAPHARIRVSRGQFHPHLGRPPSGLRGTCSARPPTPPDRPTAKPLEATGEVSNLRNGANLSPVMRSSPSRTSFDSSAMVLCPCVFLPSSGSLRPPDSDPSWYANRDKSHLNLSHDKRVRVCGSALHRSEVPDARTQALPE